MVKPISKRSCEYCGLVFTGQGYTPDGEHYFCCYGCHLVQRIMGAQGGEGIAAWLILRLGIGAFLAMNVMMISLVLYSNSEGSLGFVAVKGLHWALLVLSTPVMLILGSPFLIGGTREILLGKVSTDALVALGSLAAYFVSAVHVVSGRGQIYFDTATMLLLIVTLGRLLEASAKNKTSQAIREVMGLIPESAQVLRDGCEVEVPSCEIIKDDVMVIRPGERIPADGLIVSGSCMVEEAVFTGESQPRACTIGESVYGGSVNCDGLIHIQATAIGAESLLAQITELVRRSQYERAPVERLTERISSFFLPAVILIAISAGVYWGLIKHNPERAALSALAVLVVACPCALGLATPMAASLAIGKAARNGVLVRSGEVLERLVNIRRIFFDKTGTLTTNQLTVTNIQTCDNLSIEEALGWVAPLESVSEHSIANAIVAEALKCGIALDGVEDFRAHPGLGVQGMVTRGGISRRVTAGSLRLLLKEHALPESLSDQSDEMTCAYAGWDSVIRAKITFTDEVRLEAAGVVESLKVRGIRIAIISGDRQSPTQALGKSLGFDDLFAECSPVEKAEIIRKAHESSSAGVVMIGDGINDAPALAQADVGIATGSGTDLARQSSDITLLGDDLSRIPWVLDLASITYQIIRQNLMWAFGYNCVAIGLAFLGIVHPLIAASAMFVSSFCVIANSMRLRD